MPKTAVAEQRKAPARWIERLAREALNLVSNVLDVAAFESRPLEPLLNPIQPNEFAGDDTGRGTPSQEIALVFPPYSRTTSARGGEGSGLGLHIARCPTEAHAGRVEVESTPGAGSTLKLTLPIEPRG